MSLIFILLAVSVIAAAFWLAAGRWSAQLPEATHDLGPDARAGEPAFDVVLRGYRMDEVDATIADLQAEVQRLKSAR